MKRSNSAKERDSHDSKSKNRRYGKKRTSNSGANNNRIAVKEQITGKLEERGNNPYWYFSDEKLADQVSALAFQNLAGHPIVYDGFQMDVPNIIRINMNPSPGVQLSSTYNSSLIQSSAINLAGFRLYSKLSAYTGRTQSYAPQDISTMILAFGELISTIGFIRRAFGVSYTMSMRNRSYPKDVLEFGMLVDPDDLFNHLADYRTKFNTLLTLVNQLPIPKAIAYFDKCAALYERIYLDMQSSMAQTIIPVPWTTWLLDEQSFSGGTILKTTELCGKPVPANIAEIRGVTKPMSFYLNTLDTMISALLNSSTLQVVYTDLLNLASKVSTEFWKFDYCFEEYQVIPEVDMNFLLQFHNATIPGNPAVQTSFVTSPDVITPLNDVYPDVNHNAIYYNPGFLTLAGKANGLPRTGNVALIDMMTDAPTVTDRVEVTRLTAIGRGKIATPTGGTANTMWIDTALPDHYIVSLVMQTQTPNLAFNYITSTLQSDTTLLDGVGLLSNIDWAPRVFGIKSDDITYSGHYSGDVNFYTTIDADYIRRLHDFVGLALYDIRS